MIEANKVLLKGNKFGPDDQREDAFDSNEHVKELKSFGWEVIDDEAYKKINNVWYRYCIMARTREIPHHDELEALEKEYEDTRKQIKPIPTTNGWLAFFLFLLIIFPGIIYLSAKSKKKKQTKKENEDAKLRILEIIQKAENLRLM